MNKMEIMVVKTEDIESVISNIAMDDFMNDSKDNIDFGQLIRQLIENAKVISFDGRLVEVPKKKHLIITVSGDYHLSIDSLIGLFKDCIYNVSGNLHVLILYESFLYPYMIWYFLMTLLRINDLVTFTEFNLSKLIDAAKQAKERSGELYPMEEYALLWTAESPEHPFRKYRNDPLMEKWYELEHNKKYGKYFT